LEVARALRPRGLKSALGADSARLGWTAHSRHRSPKAGGASSRRAGRFTERLGAPRSLSPEGRVRTALENNQHTSIKGQTGRRPLALAWVSFHLGNQQNQGPQRRCYLLASISKHDAGFRRTQPLRGSVPAGESSKLLHRRTRPAAGSALQRRTAACSGSGYVLPCPQTDRL
jgi:hypothetical protein